jgi:hypothetical protein
MPAGFAEENPARGASPCPFHLHFCIRPTHQKALEGIRTAGEKDRRALSMYAVVFWMPNS